jgi:hypothetical protein
MPRPPSYTSNEHPDRMVFRYMVRDLIDGDKWGDITSFFKNELGVTWDKETAQFSAPENVWANSENLGSKLLGALHSLGMKTEKKVVLPDGKAPTAEQLEYRSKWDDMIGVSTVDGVTDEELFNMLKVKHNLTEPPMVAIVTCKVHRA